MLLPALATELKSNHFTVCLADHWVSQSLRGSFDSNELFFKGKSKAIKKEH